MKAVKIKQEHYGVIKEMTDRQAGEFVKKLCARVYEGKPLCTKDAYLKGVFVSVERELAVSRQNSLNARKGAEKRAEKRAERQRGKQLAGLGFALGSVLAAAQNAEKEGADE